MTKFSTVITRRKAIRRIFGTERLEEQEALEQNTNQAEQIEGGEETEETIHQEASENQRRALEFPLSVSAGIG